jgi:hypothetical protein
METTDHESRVRQKRAEMDKGRSEAEIIADRDVVEMNRKMGNNAALEDDERKRDQEARDATPYFVTDAVPEDITERQKYYSDLEKTLGSIVDNPDPAAQQRVRYFLDGLMQIDMFDSSAYANLLVGAARSTSGMSRFSNDLANAAPSRSTSFGGVSCEDAIYKLASASVAQAIATNGDKFGFSHLAKKVCPLAGDSIEG